MRKRWNVRRDFKYCQQSFLVECIDNDWCSDRITEGNIYLVIGTLQDYYILQKDDNYCEYIYMFQFRFKNLGER